MSKSAPSAPAAPDPTKTASAQATANAQTAAAQTALNNVNLNTPYGNSFFAQSGSATITNPDGTTSTVPTYTEQVNLSDSQQRLLNQQQSLGVQANNAASLGLRTANQALSNPVTADSLPALTTSLGAAPTLQNSYASGQLQTGYDTGGPIQRSVGYDLSGTDAHQNINAPTTFGQTAGEIQYGLDNTDFTADRDASTNAALARLAPSMAAQQESLNAQLANQGTAQGSAAWNAAQLSQNQANNDLRLGAVATGDAEQQALFGERLNAGQFNNSAQQQDYSQLLGRGQFAQQGIAQNNAAALAQAQFGLAATQANNQARLDAGNFANSAQSQQYGENAAGAGFYNSAVGQQAQQNAALASFSNSAAQSDYQNRLAAGTFGNQARDQSLSEQESINNNIINQISSLMHGGQVTGFNAPSYSTGTIDQTPLSSDVYQTAALQNQQYMAQLQASAQNQAALGSTLGGMFGGVSKKSDRRLKSEVARVAMARNGLPIYRYRLAGEPGWHVGMMADEVALVRPDAVWTDPDDGWARVDYDRSVA